MSISPAPPGPDPTAADDQPPTAGAETGPARHLPNVFTILRVILVIPAGWLLWNEAVADALVLIAIAGASDFIDGELARRFNWRTAFGAIADPAADKLLVLVVFIVLGLQGHVPAWLLGVVVGRELVIVSGALAYRILVGKYEMEPTTLSKVNTGLQIVMLLLVLVGLLGVEHPVATYASGIVDPWGFAVVGALGVVSGLHYFVLWGHRALVNVRDPQPAETGREPS